MAYRENAKPIEDIFPKTFFERHPKLKSMSSLLREWMWGATVMLVILVAFPGLYYLGGWFGNSIMGWQLGDIVQGPQRWVLGLALVLLPISVVFLPVWIGRWIKP